MLFKSFEILNYTINYNKILNKHPKKLKGPLIELLHWTLPTGNYMEMTKKVMYVIYQERHLCPFTKYNFFFYFKLHHCRSKIKTSKLLWATDSNHTRPTHTSVMHINIQSLQASSNLSFLFLMLQEDPPLVYWNLYSSSSCLILIWMNRNDYEI